MRNWSARYGAIALILGLTLFVGAPGTAWAETTGTESSDTSTSQTESAATENDTATSTPDTTPATVDDAPIDDEESAPEDEAATEVDEPEPAEEESDSEAAEEESETTAAVTGDSSTQTEAADAKKTVVSRTLASSTTEETDEGGATEPASPVVADEAPAATRLATLTVAPSAAVATLSTTAVELAPTPAPLSPIAQVAALPGRIVNVVLQLVGITTAAGEGPSPISPAPIAELFFAVFRRIEEVIGLDQPVVLPTPPTMVYDGPLDIPTPTVKQFLDAATTEYVLGGQPGGLAPFVVDGWQMRSIRLATGMDASVWVTPENQIIIAYSGTTGGTNLLFNPLIALTQILTDIQAGLGTTTPKAFDQAVDFAEEVKAEAVNQGYAAEDVFVTGHSLGAWQAQYVAQQIGMNGIGFEGPGLNTTVAGNGANSLFVNTATYGDMAGYLSSDLPGLYPLAPPYVPGGGLKPHYGPIVMLGDPDATTRMANAAALFGKGPLGTLISAVGLFGNFFASHLPGVQAYNLDIIQDPGVVPWLGINGGTVHTGFGEMTIPEFLKASSDAGILVRP